MSKNIRNQKHKIYMKTKIIKLVKRGSKYLNALEVDIKKFVFEDRVKLNCFYCLRYNKNWSCPPKIPNLNYEKIMNGYDNAILVYCSMPYQSDKEFIVIRRESTNLLHKTLLKLEKVLWENNYPLAVSFIGGSCKLCKDGCDKEKCRHPGLRRIPLEGVGMNVVKTVKACTGMNITFPPKGKLNRYGLLLW